MTGTGSWPRVVVASLALLAPARSLAAGSTLEAALERQFEHLYVSPAEPLFEAESRPRKTRRFRRARPGASRAEFDLPKPLGAFRVFVVGGSVVELFDERVLERALAPALGGRPVEVIDCGTTAYDSFRDRLTLEEVLGYEPDLIVVMSGVNEGERAPSPVFTTRRIAKALLHAATGPRPSAAAQLVLRDLLPLRDPVGLARRFERELRSMVRSARTRGVRIVVCALPWNLRDMPPRGELPLADRTFFEAWLAFDRGRLAESTERLRRWLEAPSRRTPVARAHARYLLARSLDRRGLPAAAREQYRLSLSEQVPPMPLINEAARRVAREEGAMLADLEAAFEAAAPDRLPGAELFEDDMHWARFCDRAVAEAIVRAFAGAAGASALRPSRRQAREKSWLVFRQRVWNESLGASKRPSERVVALLDAIHRDHPGLLASVDRLRPWLRAKLAGNVWDAEASQHLDAWWPVLQAHIGEVLLRRGLPDEAEARFRAALAGDPGLAFARLRLAAALARLGRAAEARRELDGLQGDERTLPEIAFYREALASEPLEPPGPPLEAPEARASEGERALWSVEGLAALEAAAERRDRKRALRVYRRLLESVGRDWLEEACSDLRAVCGPVEKELARLRALNEEGMRRLQAGDDGGAAALFERALALDPEDVSALMNAGLAYEVSGRLKEASDRFSRAVQAAPRDSRVLVEARVSLDLVRERLAASEGP